MKTTAFTKYHIAAGAKMAEFAGYNMPIEFTGINDEHMAVRNGAGVFDVSHMGEIWVKGPKALDLLQRITTNDVSKPFDGKGTRETDTHLIQNDTTNDQHEEKYVEPAVSAGEPTIFRTRPA